MSPNAVALRIVGWGRIYENSESRKLKTLKWVAVPNKMNGEGYTALVDHPDGAAHLGAWLAILEIASSREIRGTLPDGDGTIPGICRSIGRISRLPGKIFEEVVPRLLEMGWIEEIPLSQSVTDMPGDSPEVPGDGGRIPAAKGREGKGITGSPAAL